MRTFPATPLVLRVYRGVWRAAAPLVTWYVRRKDALRGVPAAATSERFGWSRPPPLSPPGAHECDYFTLWIHGASVGECLSALPLVALFALSPAAPTSSLSSQLVPSGRRNGKRARVVLSTSTPAARELLRKRLAADGTLDAVCVFAPMDHPEWVARFLDTWRPDAGLWIESELWPNLIREAAMREIPIGIVNGRMSERSFRRWQLPLLRQLARSFMQSFSMVLCQDDQNARRFTALGASTTDVLTNLKFATTQTNHLDESRVAQLQQAIGDRHSWLAVSTHEGEELQIAETHVRLAKYLRAPVLTVIVPRHPERSAAIAAELAARFPELEIALRSRDPTPSASTSVYIADSMGETELFFAAISTVFVGGTFASRGGHNPIEPLRAGCCRVFVGPNMHNFEDIVEQINGAHARTWTNSLHAPSSDGVVTLHRTPSAGPPAICSVKDATELALALSEHFRAHASPPRVPEHQELMRTLAVQSLQSHERKLLEWLAAHASK